MNLTCFNFMVFVAGVFQEPLQVQATTYIFIFANITGLWASISPIQTSHNQLYINIFYNCIGLLHLHKNLTILCILVRDLEKHRSMFFYKFLNKLYQIVFKQKNNNYFISITYKSCAFINIGQKILLLLAILTSDIFHHHYSTHKLHTCLRSNFKV